jgi:hypothetical protein
MFHISDGIFTSGTTKHITLIESGQQDYVIVWLSDHSIDAKQGQYLTIFAGDRTG